MSFVDVSVTNPVPSELEQLTQLLHDNPIVWGRYYLRTHFRFPTPAFHVRMVQEALSSENIAIAAPRESAKSTIIALLVPAHAIAFKRKRYIVIIQSTFVKAVSTLDSIKKEFKNNERLKTDFSVEVTKDTEGDSVFQHPDGFSTRIICAGREQIGALRGTKFGAYRPDLVIIDDVEDDEMVKSRERRTDLMMQFTDVVMLLGERHLTQVMVIGTVLHDDSLVANLVSQHLFPEFRKMLFRGRIEKDGKVTSLWDVKWTVEELNEMERLNPSKFAKEIQNDPVSGLSQVFFNEDFRYWRIENLQYLLFDEIGNITARGNLSDCKAAISCDLAWEEKKEADFSVILGAFLTPQADILIDTIIYKRGMRPDEMTDILYSMRDRLKGLTRGYVPIGFEKAKLEKVAKWFLGNEGRKRNDVLSFKDLQWDTDKITRIMTKLQPRYAQHMIFHKQAMGELEYQLTRFPSASHDDLPDALQGVTQLLTYPKSARKSDKEDDKFERLRRFANERSGRLRHYATSKYPFAKKGSKASLPAQVSILE